MKIDLKLMIELLVAAWLVSCGYSLGPNNSSGQNSTGGSAFNAVNSGKMPKNGAPLPHASVATIHDWIQNGAPN